MNRRGEGRREEGRKEGTKGEYIRKRQSAKTKREIKNNNENTRAKEETERRHSN